MKIATLLAALLLAVPLTAAAQTMLSLEDGMKVWKATDRMGNDVLNHPNPSERVRGQMQLFWEAGIYPPSFPAPWDLRVNFDPEERSYCDGCIWRYNEETGTWEEYGGDWHTYRCNTKRAIDDVISNANAAGWMTWTWGLAAMTASFYLRPDLAYWFGLHAAAMAATERALTSQAAEMTRDQCQNP